ncbi:MAG TPA: squalene synthase HpnC [Ignavibacteria bacterium]|nr:squalene synthase HpnC [Ignavibacteria bacterium]
MFAIDKAYKSALALAQSHYENFPVVSFLIPKRQRKHVAIIYWFARTADDIADEGEVPGEERIKKLNELQKRVDEIAEGKYQNEIDAALGNTLKINNLSPENLKNLLIAFKQDVTKKRYENFDEVLSYCKYSANPVGRLILELNKIRNDEAIKYSDSICTALQLTNFIQDIEIDYTKGRIYLPQDEMKKFNVDEKMFGLKENNANLKKLLKFNIERIEKMFEEGKLLIPFLKGRLKYEIAWTILGGEKILEKIKISDYNIFGNRPTLSKIDFLNLLRKSIFIR